MRQRARSYSRCAAIEICSIIYSTPAPPPLIGGRLLIPRIPQPRSLAADLAAGCAACWPAGTLVTPGGGGITFGLASPRTTAETLEAVVACRLAAAILRQRQHLEQDPAVSRNLVETEIAVRRAHERLDEFSDKSAPSLNELKRKIDAIERALKYLRDKGLEPGVPLSTPDETD
jgi:hypothetical protein